MMPVKWRRALDRMSRPRPVSQAICHGDNEGQVAYFYHRTIDRTTFSFVEWNENSVALICFVSCDIGQCSLGATSGVMVSTSAFLACHQSGFEGLESSGFSMCYFFLKLIARGFLRVLRFPSLLHRLMVQPIKIKLK